MTYINTEREPNAIKDWSYDNRSTTVSIKITILTSDDDHIG
jgi:hypothetical protein